MEKEAVGVASKEAKEVEEGHIKEIEVNSSNLEAHIEEAPYLTEVVVR